MLITLLIDTSPIFNQLQVRDDLWHSNEMMVGKNKLWLDWFYCHVFELNKKQKSGKSIGSFTTWNDKEKFGVSDEDFNTLHSKFFFTV